MPWIPNLFRGNITVYLVGLLWVLMNWNLQGPVIISSPFSLLYLILPLIQSTLLMKCPLGTVWWCYSPSRKLPHDGTERRTFFFFFQMPLHHVFFMFINVNYQFLRCLWPCSYNYCWIRVGANQGVDKHWCSGWWVLFNYDATCTLGTAWVRGNNGKKAHSSHTPRG